MLDLKDAEVDFKVHDAYVAFSAEIVRLAVLLASGVFAFFLAVAGAHPSPNVFAELIAPARRNLVAGLCFMAAAVFFGFAHRYFAIDFMATYVQNIRHGKSSGRDWRLRASSFAIWAAPACLLVGAVFLFTSVYKVIGQI